MNLYATLTKDSLLYCYEIAPHDDERSRLTIIGQSERGVITGMLVLIGTREEFLTLSKRCFEAASPKEKTHEPCDNPGF